MCFTTDNLRSTAQLYKIELVLLHRHDNMRISHIVQ